MVNGRPSAVGGAAAVAGQVQARIDDVDAFARNAEVVRHEVGVVAAGGDEAVDLAAVLADQRRAPAARYGSGSDSRKMSSPCSEQRTGTPSRRLSSWHHAGEEDVGQVDDLRLDLVRQPVDELGDLLALLAVFALEHGDGQVAQVLGLRLDGEARHPAQQPRGVEQAVEEPGRVAEQAELLLQVDVDAAEEDALLADVLLVGADGRVGRDEQRVVARAARGRRRACCRACSCRRTCPRRRR